MKFWQTVITSLVVSAAVAAPIIVAVRIPLAATTVENPVPAERVIDVLPTPPGTDIPVVQVEVGELVRLTAGGDAVAWTSVPAVADWLSYGDANGACVMSFRRVGEYTVVVAVAAVGNVEQRKIVIQVGTPEPGPGPIPGPAASAWDGKIAAWLAGNPAAKQGAARLADSFASVAANVEAKLAAGELMTVDQVVALTVTANQSALVGVGGDWTAFRSSLSAELQRMATTGELTTMRQHVDNWKLIAAALRRVASVG